MPLRRNDDPGQISRARAFRKTQTAGEQALWQALRDNNYGFRVRRQYPLGRYILDFYVPSAKLCIEIDGPHHDRLKDQARDFELAESAILTIRIKAEDLRGREDVWAEAVQKLVVERRALFARSRRHPHP